MQSKYLTAPTALLSAWISFSIIATKRSHPLLVSIADTQAQALLQSAVESASCPATDVPLPYGSLWPVLPIVRTPPSCLRPREFLIP